MAEPYLQAVMSLWLLTSVTLLASEVQGQPGTLTCAATDRAAANESTAFLGPLRHVTAAGVDFAYHRFHIGEVKDKTPLVLMMGFGGTMSEWTPAFLRMLAQGREVVIFDYMAQGLSKEVMPSTAPIALDLVTTTMSFMEALGLHRPNVLGWSLGGSVAALILSQDPQAVGKVLALAGAPPDANYVPASPEVDAIFYNPNITQVERAELFINTSTLEGEKAACEWLAGYAAMPPDPAHPETNLRFQEGEMQVLELAALANITWLPGPGFNNPVLLLAGGEDVVVPPANQLKLVNSVPGASLVWFPTGGHGFFWQYPEKALAYINAFLSPDP